MAFCYSRLFEVPAFLLTDMLLSLCNQTKQKSYNGDDNKSETKPKKVVKFIANFLDSFSIVLFFFKVFKTENKGPLQVSGKVKVPFGRIVIGTLKYLIKYVTKFNLPFPFDRNNII